MPQYDFIPPHHAACDAAGVIGSALEIGIGGEPVNLVVLYFFFSLDTKAAAASSLYIILFSQAANFLITLLARTVPAFTVITLVLMVFGGILGGMAGRSINREMNNAAVDKLFVGLMVVIIVMSLYNSRQYSLA